MHRLVRQFMSMALAAVLAAGCTIQPRPDPSDPEASSIEYKLPVTAAQLSLHLTITDCADPKAKANVTLSPVVRPSPDDEHSFRIKGSNLASFTKKRELKVDVYPHGAIKSINATTSDRTATIFANVLKLASLLPLADAPVRSNGSVTCNDRTKQAVQDVKSVQSQIKILQQDLAKGVATDPAATQEKIDALAKEVARIQSERLTLTLIQIIDFWPEINGGIASWPGAELEKWLAGTGQRSVNTFSVAWCVHKQSDEKEPACTAQVARGYQSKLKDTKAKPAPILCAKSQCATTLVFREPVGAVLTLVAVNDDLGVPADSQLGKVSFPMAQWGEVSYFPLSAGFGASKSLSLALDEFGRRTSFGWSSGAQGEELTSSIQGVTDAVTAFRSARDGEDLAAKKAEVDALETQQKLNKLRRCQAVLDAGGFVCPAE